MSEEIEYDLSKGNTLFSYTEGLVAARRASDKDINGYLYPRDTQDRLAPIGDYLSRVMGFDHTNWSSYPPFLLYPTVGTTGGFRAVLQTIKMKFDEINKDRPKKRQCKPVIVAPIPSYGYFFSSARELGFEIETFDRRADEEWAVSPQDLFCDA